MTRETTVLVEQSPVGAREVSALNEKAWLTQFGDPQGSRALAQHALAAVRLVGDECGAAYARISLACYEMRHGDRELAEREFSELKQCFAQRHDLLGELRACFGLAVLYSRAGNTESAYAELIGFSTGLDRLAAVDAFVVSNALGAICADGGLKDEAMRFFYKALNAARELQSNDHLTLVLSNLGDVQHSAGNYEDAVRFLVEAYDLVAQSQLASLGPLVAGNLAMCQLAIGAHQAAYETIEPYLSMGKDYVHIGRSDKAFFQSIAAHTFAAREEWDAAKACIATALESADALNDLQVCTHCYWVCGLIERGQGRLGESLEALRKAESYLGRLRDPYYPIQLYRELSRVHAALGQWQPAYEYLERHQQLYQCSLGSATRARAQMLQIQSELADAERERDFAIQKHAEAERGRRELEALNSELAFKVDEIQRLQAKLRDQAIRDPLTDLYNRRYLQEELSNEIRLAERRYYPISIVLIDLDHFKRVNDGHGHPVGDKVLVELADLMRANIRGSDFACRFGGEEFCLVLSDIGLDRALVRIHHLLERFRALSVPLADGGRLAGLTFSAGVAEYPRHGRSADALLKAADSALYRAKAAGRDRIFEAK
ncbi:diguanylate cyclase [Chitinimonas sp.]|uniref:tetratricopeptide repeat-containing diguanylate cyclase n=1 Tax=Chitinimonas sp. TaxID=1934313 RepID=UPI0035AFF4A0